jgi:hypothetical protein
MASTLLRFTNPCGLPNHRQARAPRRARQNGTCAKTPRPKKTKISAYFTYLDALHSLATSSGAPFRDMDRFFTCW